MRLPEMNQRIKDIVQFKTNGNVSKFVDLLTEINGKEVLSQQRLNRIFIIDNRTGKIPGVPSTVITTILKSFPEVNKEWLLSGDGNMTGQVKKEDKLTNILRDIEERMIRAEAHLEVYESALAGLMAENKTDFTKKVGELRHEIKEAVNRRFDELNKKRG